MKLFHKPKALHALAIDKPEATLSALDTQDMVYNALILPLARAVDRLASTVRLTQFDP